MSRAIESTPILYGKKAKSFRDEMKRPATKAEKESYKHAQKVFAEIKFIKP
ncbi:hypothetical protein [Methanobrevibacter sp. UBA337]|jgi:hypothetical protein|uniref:hypothetical protein n=1 Tax=Methanobrevibacter sp. UBA337 TaxID=1915480 RepID=UPI0039B89ADC